jgi:hypothetical protein
LAYRRRTASSPVGPILAGVVLLLLVVAGAWFFLRPVEPLVDDWAPSALEGARDQVPGDEPAAPEAVEPLDLPELDRSDELVRRLVSGLSAHPQLARWLVTDALVERFVGTVLDLAGGFHPAEHVPFLRPEAPFSARAEGGRTVIAPEAYARYDLLAAVVQSLDADGTVRLFRQLRPLVDEAWERKGSPGDFNEALRMAVGNLLEVRVPDTAPEVVEEEGVWIFRDAELEARRGAAKALIRMGPGNAARVQGKLREMEARLP